MINVSFLVRVDISDSGITAFVSTGDVPSKVFFASPLLLGMIATVFFLCFLYVKRVTQHQMRANTMEDQMMQHFQNPPPTAPEYVEEPEGNNTVTLVDPVCFADEDIPYAQCFETAKTEVVPTARVGSRKKKKLTKEQKYHLFLRAKEAVNKKTK